MDKPEDFANDTSKLEAQLRGALRHTPAPDGFTDRVMERIAQRDATGAKVVTFKPQQATRVSRPSAQPSAQTAAWWSAIAATLLLAAGGTTLHHRRVQKEREATQVQAQLDLALRLTSHALDEVQDGVERTPAGRFTTVLLTEKEGKER